MLSLEHPALSLKDVEEYLEDLGLPARRIDHRAVRFEHEGGVFLFILDDALPFFFTIQANHLVPDRLIDGVEMVSIEERHALLSDLCHEFNASYKLVKFQVFKDSTVNASIEGCANQVSDMKPWFRFCLGLMKTAIKSFIGRYSSAVASVDLMGSGLSLH